MKPLIEFDTIDNDDIELLDPPTARVGLRVKDVHAVNGFLPDGPQDRCVVTTTTGRAMVVKGSIGYILARVNQARTEW